VDAIARFLRIILVTASVTAAVSRPRAPANPIVAAIFRFLAIISLSLRVLRFAHLYHEETTKTKPVAFTAALLSAKHAVI
jgi:hypothetical protein